MSVYPNRCTLVTIGTLWLLSSPGQACTVTASEVIFGIYDTLGNFPLDGRGDVEVTCPEFTSYTVSLSQGQGSFNPRLMGNEFANTLTYNLFTDVTYQFIWGDGTAGTSTVGGEAEAQGEVHSVYGLIPGDQNVPAGQYTDTIFVTVTF